MNKQMHNYSHPTKDIQGITSFQLKGMSFCLCLTGSVAVINAPSLARELMKHGAEVFAVMTKKATDFIQAELMEWATGNPVILDITGKIEHVAMAGERENSKGIADMVIVYPSSANSIGKIANGISDTPVTAICMVALGSNTPIILVPAMHDSMFRNQIVQENIEKLRSLGVHIVNPRMEENKAKVATADEVLTEVFDYISKSSFLEQKGNDLLEKKFIITAGPSREWIDDVRFLSNPSTGRMGIALTEAILSRGGEVCLLLGPTSIHPPSHPKLIVKYPISTQDFVNIMTEELSHKTYDVLISAAALSDFTPNKHQSGKISSDISHLVVEFKSTPKLIQIARDLSKDLIILGFKAESSLDFDLIIDHAYQRMQDSKIDLIIANSIHPEAEGRGFKSNTNEVYIINTDKMVEHVQLTSKLEIAHRILDRIKQDFW
ncbi:MAG: bifunctional phosphopantothenoylcysteine decarboxylase/phosphopantothenate--cysteine ligase CoaBC [Promethearchaeota archaeon]